MKTNKTEVRNGIGFTGLLAIAFIVLKLTKVIYWSWAWVLSPIWIPLCLWILGFIVFVIVTCVKDSNHKKRIRN